MLSIFIPQEILEDILIENMASDTKPEDQDVWFKIFTKQKVIFVSSWEKKRYYLNDPEEDPLIRLSNAYGVKVLYATQFIEDIPLNHRLVTNYWNGVFLLDISPKDAAEIQRDYGVICQSTAQMNASVLMDLGLRFSFKEGPTKYYWDKILENISFKHYPSNRLILIDRYLFAGEGSLENVLDNIFDIMDNMLPIHKIIGAYKVTLIIAQPKEGDSYPLSTIAENVYRLVPDLARPYPINIEILYLTNKSCLFPFTHNRCIMTNYTITQVDHMLNAFENAKDENGNTIRKSRCLQSIVPQGLFTPMGLNDKCDSPHEIHHYLMSAIYSYLFKGEKKSKSSTPKCIYAYNGKIMNISNKYETKRIYGRWLLTEKDI